jgi:hypothetical protein
VDRVLAASRAGSTGTVSWRMTGRVSRPSSTRCTVTPVVSTPAASASSIASRPGRRQQRRVHVDDASREAVEERLRQQVHVAGEHDELDAVLLEPGRHHEVALVAVGVAVEREVAGRNAGGPARSSAYASLLFDATAATAGPRR